MDEQPGQTAPSDQTAPDLDGLLDRLRSKVDQRRRDGEYPPGLEEELAEHFRRIAGSTLREERPSVRRQLDQVRLPAADPARVAAATSSGLPGGAAIHTTVSRLVSRQTAGVLAQVQELADAVWRALTVLADATDWATAPGQRETAHLVSLVDGVVERIAAYERAPEASAAGVAELARRVERLEAVEASRHARPWFNPAAIGEGLEDEGAGARLAALLEGTDPVMELGPASSSAPGGEVVEGEPLTVLASWPDRSLGGVLAADVVERIGAQDLLDLVRSAADKLFPGGRLVLRATNPRSLWGLAHGSAGRPDRALVDPGWLSLCCREAGFAEVEVEWGERPGEGAGRAGVGEESEAHRILFAPVSYIVVATR